MWWNLLQRGSQCWLHVGNCFFDLMFIAFVIIIKLNSLTQRTLPLCLTVNWNAFVQLIDNLSLPTCEKKRLLLFSSSAVSTLCDPQGLQHARLTCPSPAPRACSKSWPWVGDVIQPSRPLSSPSPPAFNLSQHQGLLKWVSSSHQVAKASASASILPINIQGWFPLRLTGLISLQSKRFSRVFSNTTVQKHQFFSTPPSLWSNSHIHTWLQEKL